MDLCVLRRGLGNTGSCAALSLGGGGGGVLENANSKFAILLSFVFMTTEYPVKY